MEKARKSHYPFPSGHRLKSVKLYWLCSDAESRKFSEKDILTAFTISSRPRRKAGETMGKVADRTDVWNVYPLVSRTCCREPINKNPYKLRTPQEKEKIIWKRILIRILLMKCLRR